MVFQDSEMDLLICMLSPIPTILGSWKYKGGGAFYNNSDIYKINKDTIEGLQYKKNNIRVLDQSRIGSIFCNEKRCVKWRRNSKRVNY